MTECFTLIHTNLVWTFIQTRVDVNIYHVVSVQHHLIHMIKC